MIDRIEFGEPAYRIRPLGGKDDGSREGRSGGAPKRFQDLLKEKGKRREPFSGDHENSFQAREKADLPIASATQTGHPHARVVAEERKEDVRHIDILVS